MICDIYRMGLLDLRFLRQFMEIAETGSLREAARRLNMTQPPLSQAVKAVEDRLQVNLFDRTVKGMRLTRAGETLRREAETLLPRIDRAVLRVKDVAREVQPLRIGFVSAALNEVLPRLLRSLLAEGKPTPVLQEMTTLGQVAALTNGQLDLGFVHPPVAIPNDIQIVSLGRDRLLAALPADHTLAGKKALSFSEIVDEPFVLFPRDQGPSLYGAIERAAYDAGGTLRIAAEAQRVHSQLALIAGGLGIGLVPSSLARSLQFKGVVYRDLVDAPSLYLELAILSTTVLVREVCAPLLNVDAEAAH